MGIIANIEKRASRPGAGPLDDVWYFPGLDFFGGLVTSKSGAVVNEHTALNLSIVWCCIRILAETVSSLPLILYRRKDRGKERAMDHPLYHILHNHPNPEMTSMSFRECQMAHIASWGNGYAEIVRNRLGDITQLWPIPPNRVTPKRNDNDKLFYSITMKDGTKKPFSKDIIFHVPGLGYDGVKGYSPIKMAKDAIGLGIALEEFGNNFFSNGTNIGGVVSHPGKLSPEAHGRLKNDLKEKHQGLGKTHQLMFLEEGMKYDKIGIPPEESQFLQTRKFQNIDIGTRFYRIPPHMYGEMDRATFSNIEQQSLEFVIYTLRPWLVRIEQAYNTILLSPEEQGEYFFEHLVDGLLRGDIKTRYEAYAIGRQNGWLSGNDILEMENRNGIGDKGDIYTIQLNMVDLESVGQNTMPIPGKQENSLTKRDLTKEKRSVLIRNRLAKAYHRLYLDAAEKIVLKEIKSIRSALKKELQRSATDFNKWIDEFYGDFPDYIRKKLMPVLENYAEAVKGTALDEIGSDAEADIRDFLNKYMDGYSARHVNSSIGQLRGMMKDVEPEKLGEALESRVDEWEETRAGKIADDEVVRAGGAVARTVWTLAGVTTFIWATQGSEACEFCQQLDGKVVGKDSVFIKQGDTLDSATQGEMKVSGNHLHPPLHEGCVCAVLPGG